MAKKETSTDIPSTSFLRQCLYTILIFGAVTALFNVVVDPYLLFDLPRAAEFNARKPAIEIYQQEHLIKAYDVLRAEPKTLLLGTSSVAIGLDASSTAWPDSARPVYNLGMPGEGYFAIRRYLQHVVSRQKLHTVVLGLEFRNFLNLFAPQHEPPFESRLAATASGIPNPIFGIQHVTDIAYSTLSLDTLLESAHTLSGNLSGDSSDTVSGNIDTYWLRTKISKVGAYPVIVLTDLFYARLFRDSQLDIDIDAWNNVRRIFEICQDHDINLIVILEPTHVDELELVDIAGKWNVMEEWKRKLTRMVSDYGASQGRAHIELWDFYGYDAYSTETVPYTKTALRWFFEPNHYTRPLGDLMIQRIAGSGDPSFGVKLTPNNIESHLTEVRRKQYQYRTEQKQDAERVRRLYAEIS